MLANRVEKWIEEWKQQGLQQGELRGEQRGEANLLLRQLERRFGVLPVWARERVLAANTATLDEWGLLLPDAATSDDVFT